MTQLQKVDLTDQFIELVRRAATNLPADMDEALKNAEQNEEEGSAAKGALDTILLNVQMAREYSTPICQDTGTPIFEVYYPLGVSTRALANQIRRAVSVATENSFLRPNAVDSLTGENSGNNTGDDFPTMHFHEWDADFIHVDLLLKGGGCENVSTQYKLPDAGLKAGRDLEGVRRV
ncbi:MAG: fumarate hydratase, partial [Anaerolineaceae bacterium]